MLSFNGIAQDTLFFMNYDTLLAKVISIKQNEIQYKKFSNLEGPSYYIKSKKVNRIVYPSGDTDEFNQLIQKTTYVGEQATITLTDGDKFEVFLYQVDARDITYKKKENVEGPQYYKSLKNVHKIVYSNGEEQIFSELKKPKKKVQRVSVSKKISVEWNSYTIGGRRISSKKVEEKLKALNDPAVDKLLREAKQVKGLSKTLGYSSIGFAIGGVGTAFIGLVIYSINSEKTALMFSGWMGAITLVELIGSGALHPVYKDRMRRAIALYNDKLNK